MSSIQTSSNSSAIQTNSMTLGSIQHQNLTNQTYQQSIKNDKKSSNVLLVVPPQPQRRPSNTNSSIAAPRFTQEEKNLLFDLFKENEDIIDIKYRKNTSKKIISVRECWERITADYNGNAVISAKRNTKQIQKFWLNSRLRNHYPGRVDPPEIKPKPKIKRQKQQQLDVPHAHTHHVPIRSKDDLIKVQPNERLQNIKFEAVDTNDLDNEIEMVDEEELQQIEISTSSNDVGLNGEDQPQQYNIDHISAEKLTLSDLLEFKNSRNQREDIVLQIKSAEPQQHKEITSIIPTYTASYRLSSSGQPTGVANIPAFIAADPQTYHSFQIQTPNNIQGNKSPVQPVILTHQSPTQQHQQQSNQFCLHHLQPQLQTIPNKSSEIESNEEKISEFKLKEAELRFKEEQIKLEQAKIDLQNSKEEMKHRKEMHAYQIEEMKLKLQVLVEEQVHNKNKHIEIIKRKI